MTQQGGELERGVFYGLDNGLQPFVALEFPVGKAGSTLGLFGQGFTGATTGYVTVTGPTGTASSSAKFYVRP